MARGQKGGKIHGGKPKATGSAGGGSLFGNVKPKRTGSSSGGKVGQPGTSNVKSGKRSAGK